MKKVKLFINGTGLIGSGLLEQIKQKKSDEILVVGIANRENFLVDKNGTDLHSWEERLDKNGEKNDKETVVKHVVSIAKEHGIFVDVTASDSLPFLYEELLQNGISIVAANKKANAGSLSLYKSLREAAKRGKSFFLYETNVGAGLPLISTIQDLLATGDTIEKIEGIMSGTLSFLFNTFSGDMLFSNLLKKAKEEGFTEPDPRDDLNGLDFGRKLLILAREIGLDLELSDISIQNLVPKSCESAVTVSEFFEKLKDEDSHFETLKNDAERSGKVLRYIGEITPDKNPSCSLQMIDKNHPFFSLSGSDNIFAIYSKRYNKQPIVIKGPGAGKDVTAAGVFADILKIGKLYEQRH